MATRARKASAAPHRTPMQWEIWQVNQVASRAATSPPTPPDPDKNERPFIVISPNAYNRGGLEVVCLPISGKQYVQMFEVELTPELVSGLTKVCYVKCFKPVTMDVQFLKQYRGTLADDVKINEIRDTLKEFLEL